MISDSEPGNGSGDSTNLLSIAETSEALSPRCMKPKALSDGALSSGPSMGVLNKAPTDERACKASAAQTLPSTPLAGMTIGRSQHGRTTCFVIACLDGYKATGL